MMEADTGVSGKKTDLTLSRTPQRRTLAKGKQKKIKKTLLDKVFLASLVENSNDYLHMIELTSQSSYPVIFQDLQCLINRFDAEYKNGDLAPSNVGIDVIDIYFS
jgi:hypothetical protein